MAQIDILKDVMSYSLRKFEHCIIGSHIYYLFNNERYAIGKLHKSSTRNEFDGVTIVYISKLFGRIDECEILFKDVFIDSKRASINVNVSTDEYEWYESLYPTDRDLNRLADHVERYINIIGEFGENMYDYSSAMVLATEAAFVGYTGQDKVAPPPQQDYISKPTEPEELDSIAQLGYESDPEVYSEPENPGQEPEQPSPFVHDNMPEPDIQLNSTENESQEALITGAEPLEEAAAEDLQEEKSIEIPEFVPEEEPDIAPRRGIFSFLRGRNRNAHKEETQKETVIEKEPTAFTSYSIGENYYKITATLYEKENGLYKLSIDGIGKMENFKNVPWSKYAELIDEVTISEGILNIGNNAFKSFSLLKKIVLPMSMRKIGTSAFEFCGRLEDVIWREGLTEIGDFAFAGTESLKKVVLPDSLAVIRDYGFEKKTGIEILCKDPRKLKLGEGLSVSDLSSLEGDKAPLSIRDYMKCEE